MGGVGCPVLNLQEQLRALETYLYNGTVATEDSPLFFSPLLEHTPHLPAGVLRLQDLQARLSQVHAQQEQLLRQVDNFTQSPGLAPSHPDWDSSEEDEKGGAAFMGRGLWA